MMKKILHILPMLAVLGFLVLQSSCWNNGYDPDYSFVISMNATQASSSTKGVINGIDDLKNENFGVYGFKSYQSDKAIMVFANQQVSWTASAEKWGYSPLKYWDRDQQYYYAAYAPYLGTTAGSAPYVSHNETNGSAVAHIMTINDIPNWQPLSIGYYTSGDTNSQDESMSDNAYDLLTDYDNGRAVDYLSPSGQNGKRGNGYVEFEFKHILAQFRVFVSFPDMPDNYDTEFRITKFEFGTDKDREDNEVNGKVPDNSNSRYELNYSSVDQTDGLTKYSEAFSSVNKGTAQLYPISPKNPLADNPEIFMVHKAENNPELLLSYLCVPFSVGDDGGLYVRVEYQSNQANAGWKNETPEIIKISESLKAFEAGNIYTLNLRFDKGKKIDLINVGVSKWQDGVTINHPVFNW